MKHEIKQQEIECVERNGIGYDKMEHYDLSEEEMLGQFEFNHIKYKEIIEQICSSWDKATNNDFFLYIEVLRCLNICQVTSGKDNFCFKIPRDKLKYLVSSESVRRARQSLNAKGLCLPTNPIIIERRAKREKALRKYFGGEKK